ncbi:lytic polysaccharide monooxygenase [Streptomyces sp. H10-C2]|uniref:lytic polysaccharide monooxygenase auxiliary activity family 9 protein n=1 Tax=unclassified Streptomyces TaxID=2593676 RepID=UPI0024B95E7D|nr:MULTISPECIES: lytic polysaccharide monooxygenase [unclassified Streptomyces]MDJ0343124.1 lytic polysaccharide monooxygenase [Streptomyces sp. PH10-H1]MDJ0371066.1 lytic polysaccharide monooxygenase [Streptomyces sp. H10-C2]
MTVRRKAAAVAVMGFAPLVLTGLAAAPASAHGSMENPVSRVSACYAEGPENPRSAACKAAVAAGGRQALYDWNSVRDGEAGGRSRSKVPDGQLCSGGNAEYKGLDLARADWPATGMSSGSFTFKYRATAPHKGSFDLYITKDGYDPSKQLKWSDLEAKPFASVTDPTLTNGSYVFSGTVPKRAGRHLIYSVWQRSDSTEAFYSCSDVVFGKDTGGSAPAPSVPSHTPAQGASHSAPATADPAPSASAPSEAQIAAGTSKSTVHHDHTAAITSAPAGNAPKADGSAAPADGTNLAETGGSSSTGPLAIGGAAVVAIGCSVLLTTVRRRAAAAGRHRS